MDNDLIAGDTEFDGDAIIAGLCLCGLSATVVIWLLWELICWLFL